MLNKRTGFVTLLLLFILQTGRPQSSAEKNSITLIGTIHSGNRHFGYKTLHNAINKINPDIIFIEQSNNHRQVFGLQTASFLGIWNPGIEQRALQKYMKKNKRCIIIPYDTAIQERKKYIQTLTKNTDEIMNDLATIANNGQMDKNDSLNFATYIEKRNNWFKVIYDTTLERINKPDIVEVARLLYQKYSPVLTGIVDKYVKNLALKDWFVKKDAFWVERNTHMGKKITDHLHQHKGKRVIILSGLAHVYFLKDYLLLNSPDNILPFSE